MHKVHLKSLSSLDTDAFKELIEQYATDTEGLSVYKAIAYTTGIDRDGEVAEHSFIEQLAEKLIGKPVIKNHDWHDVDGTVGTIIKTEVLGDDLLAYFYVADEEVKDKINKGIYKGVSCGFDPITAIIDDVLHFIGCKDAFEMSLVTVPAVPKASIKIKTFSMKGEKAMPFNFLKRQKLVAKYPSLKSIEPEVLDELAGDDIEVTEADVENLLKENEELKAKVAELENQVTGYKEAEAKTKSETLILDETTKAVDELNPTVEAKEVILDEAKEAVEKGDLIVEHVDDADVVKGLDMFIDKVRVKYTKLGLLNKKAVVEVKQTEVVETKQDTKVEVKTFGFTAEQFKEPVTKKNSDEQVVTKHFR